MSGDDEIPEEVKLIIDKGVEITELLCAIEDPRVVSKVISVAIAHLLCHRVSSEDSAHAMFEMIMDDVDSAVITTKKFGCTSWVEGTPH